MLWFVFGSLSLASALPPIFLFPSSEVEPESIRDSREAEFDLFIESWEAKFDLLRESWEAKFDVLRSQILEYQKPEDLPDEIANLVHCIKEDEATKEDIRKKRGIIPALVSRTPGWYNCVLKEKVSQEGQRRKRSVSGPEDLEEASSFYEEN